MSVRQNGVIIAGSGSGSVDVDNSTITTNAMDEIQAVATINANTAAGATNPVYDWVGTLAEHQAQNIETLHPDWICYITDDVSGGDSVYTKSEVDTLLAGKVDTGHELIAYQNPTSGNNYTWYRKYSDGWVEQGGTTSNFTNTAAYTSDDKVVSLPVAMANTKYDVQATLFSDISLGNGSISGYSYRVILPQIYSTTQFTIFQYTNNLAGGTSCCAKWYVCGMAAS